MNRRRLRGKFERETRLSLFRHTHALAPKQLLIATTQANKKPLALAAIDLATRVNDVAPLLGALPGRMAATRRARGDHTSFVSTATNLSNVPVVAMVTRGA